MANSIAENKYTIRNTTVQVKSFRLQIFFLSLFYAQFIHWKNCLSLKMATIE